MTAWPPRWLTPVDAEALARGDGDDYATFIEHGVTVKDLEDNRRRQMAHLRQVCPAVVLLEPDGFCDRVWDELIDGYAALLVNA
jgi:hypothetical protein